MPDKRIEVDAYSGSREEETPRSFILYGEKVEVLEIDRRWVEEEFKERARKRFFRIKGNDGYLHTLYYDEMKKEWFIRKAG